MFANPTEYDRNLAELRNLLVDAEVEQIVARIINSRSATILGIDVDEVVAAAIANEFDVAQNSVVFVGSAKLGFSIVEKRKNGRLLGERYRRFSDNSDMDAAVVNPELFDRIWFETYSFFGRAGRWAEISRFEHYFFQGWIRPDLLPSDATFQRKNDWMQFCNNLSKHPGLDGHKVRLGVYKNFDFLQGYQAKAVSQCQNIERAEAQS